MNSYNLNSSDSFSVDIMDLYYQNEDDDIFHSIRKKLDLHLDHELDRVSAKNVNSHQPLISKNEEIINLSGYKEKGIWKRTTEWITDNPGTAITGAILIGSGIAYLFNKYQDKSSTTIEVKRRKRRKPRTEEGDSITQEPELKESNEVSEISMRGKVAAAVTAAAASVTFDEISIVASAPVIGYGLWQDQPLMVYAGVGLLVGCLFRKMLFKGDLKKLSKSQKAFNAARDTNDLYAPKYVEALGGVIFSEVLRPRK